MLGKVHHLEMILSFVGSCFSQIGTGCMPQATTMVAISTQLTLCIKNLILPASQATANIKTEKLVPYPQSISNIKSWFHIPTMFESTSSCDPKTGWWSPRFHGDRLMAPAPAKPGERRNVKKSFELRTHPAPFSRWQPKKNSKKIVMILVSSIFTIKYPSLKHTH